MNRRLAILALTEKYKLSAQHHAEIKRLAGIGQQPAALSQHLQTGIAVLAAALGGLGLLFWVAANWQLLSSGSRFALLEIVLTVALLGAWLRPAARLPLSLLGFIACGSMLAHFGQTYQTGADPWQLFALWAALTLPLCFSVRHDALWMAWAIVALTAAVLFSSIVPGRTLLHSSLGSWVPAIALAAAFRFVPGTGAWPMRLCMIYATMGLSWVAFVSLFDDKDYGYYLLTLLSIAALAYAFCLRKLFDVFVISALGLGANVLLIAGLIRLLAVSNSDLTTAAMLMIGCAAAALLAGTVKLIMYLARTYSGEDMA